MHALKHAGQGESANSANSRQAWQERLNPAWLRSICCSRCCQKNEPVKGDEDSDSDSSSSSSSSDRPAFQKESTTSQVFKFNKKPKEEPVVKPTLLAQLKSVEASDEKGEDKYKEVLIHAAVNRGPPSSEAINDYYVIELVKNQQILRQVLKRSMAWRQWALKQKCGAHEVLVEVKNIINAIARLKIDDLSTLKQAEFILNDIALDIRDYINDRISGNELTIEEDILEEYL